MINKILTKSIIHGRGLLGEVINSFDKGVLPEVKVSDNIKILTVVNKGTVDNAILGKSNIIDNSVEFIVVDKYIKWITKIKELYNYIRNNFENLPEYILYCDGFDVVIINDIQNHRDILNYYKCKVLFNSEPKFWGTGAYTPKDYPNYRHDLNNKIANEYIQKNKIKYELNDNNYQQSLNAGVFLGEKEFLFKLLGECLDFMNDDYHKGYPYGETDDQLLLRYFHNKYFEDIAIDLFHKMMFWGTKDSLKKEINILSPDLLNNERIKYEKINNI